MNTRHALLATAWLAGLCASAHADPVNDFAASVFEPCKAHYAGLTAGGVNPGGLPGTWVRKVSTSHKLSYEAQYPPGRNAAPMATIRIELSEQFAHATSEAEAGRQGPGPDNPATRSLTRLHYIYQDNRWTTSGADLHTESKLKDTTLWAPPLDTRLDRHAMLSSNDPWRACVR